MEALQAQFEALERTGARFSWNVLPPSRAAADEWVLPVAAVYAPRAPLGLEPLPYAPQRCNSCTAVLSPFATVDFGTGTWTCPFCNGRCQFPPAYAGIGPERLPAELMREHVALDYVVEARETGPPAFLFVLDTCASESEFAAAKDAVLLAMQQLPPATLVGLITFGAAAQLYELGFELCAKSYVFRGGPAVTRAQLADLLRAGAASEGRAATAGPAARGRFLRPLGEVEESLEALLDDVCRDQQVVPAERRPLRCTGVALSLAVGLLESALAGQTARVLCLLAGPPTVGDGRVVGTDRREGLRSWSDLRKERAEHAAAAAAFYEALAARVPHGHAVDLFACSLDDVGLYEMEPLARQTNGMLLPGTKFASDRFACTLSRYLAGPHAGDAALAVQTSRGLAVRGAIGHARGLGRKTQCVSDRPVGLGGTAAWALGGLDAGGALAVYFDVGDAGGAGAAFVQFTTAFRDAAGRQVLRVTTSCLRFAPEATPAVALQGLDQEAAVAALVRQVVWRSHEEEPEDLLRWLDRALIRACKVLGEYQPEQPASFRLAPTAALVPQFLFHLRRSKLMQRFGFSPDETAAFWHALLRETTGNTLAIIQPTLNAYGEVGLGVPVLLSTESVRPDRLLLLDTYFTVLVYRGATVRAWVEAGHADDPANPGLAALLAAPYEEAARIAEARFPAPRIVHCEEGGSQARFLLSVLDPAQGAGAERLATDDVSLDLFLEHLRKLVVAKG